MKEEIIENIKKIHLKTVFFNERPQKPDFFYLENEIIDNMNKYTHMEFYIYGYLAMKDPDGVKLIDLYKYLLNQRGIKKIQESILSLYSKKLIIIEMPINYFGQEKDISFLDLAFKYLNKIKKEPICSQIT